MAIKSCLFSKDTDGVVLFEFTGIPHVLRQMADEALVEYTVKELECWFDEQWQVWAPCGWVWSELRRAYVQDPEDLTDQAAEHEALTLAENGLRGA